MLFRTPLMLFALSIVGCRAQVPCQGRPIDIFFLIDASTFPRNSFESFKSLVQEILKGYTMGPNGLQVGVAAYGDGATLNIPLPYNKNESSLLEAVDGIQALVGPRNLHMGLEMFEASIAGRRGQGVPLILILLIDGHPADLQSVSTIAERIPNWDAKIFVVSLGTEVTREVRSLSCNNFTLFVYADTQEMFDAIPTIQRAYCAVTLANTRCEAIAPPPAPQIIPPQGLVCSFSETEEDGELIAATVECQTKQVNPEPICIFLVQTDGGFYGTQDGEIDYTHVSNGDGTFSSNCSMKIPIEDLGEGEHKFMGRMVLKGVSITAVPQPPRPAHGSLTLALPRAAHSCPNELKENYLCGKPTTCTCYLDDDGYPVGKPLWTSQGEQLDTDVLAVAYDPRAPEVDGVCEGVSSLGRRFGSRLQITNTTECQLPVVPVSPVPQRSLP